MHRTPWDLREAAPAAPAGGGRGFGGGGGRGGQAAAGDAAPASEEATAQQQAAGRGGRGGRGGPLVKPGTYTVQLGKLVNGSVTALGESRKVEVVPLEPSNR